MIESRYTDLLPALTDEEFSALKDDIAERGCLVPVELDEEGNVLDGAHRLRACEELGIKAPTITRRGYTEGEKKAHAIALNLQRRQLDRDKRRELHIELRKAGKSLREIAEASGVSPQSVMRDVAGVPSGTPRTTGRDGKSYPTTRPKPAPVLDFTEAITKREHQREERKANRPAPTPTPKFEKGSFPVLYADPPWRYEHVPVSESRAIENQYPTMSLEEIKALEVPAADDAVLYLWTTSPKLAESLEVIDAWGFEYRTSAVWVKDRIGMGYYFRQQHELLLVAKRGNLPTPEPGVRPASVIEAPRQQHSAKPVEVYELLERMYPDLPRIELFARSGREGWTQWGNQAPEAA